MPAVIEGDASSDITENENVPAELPFPPVTKKHIMNCSYHSWHPKYVCRPELSCFLRTRRERKCLTNLRSQIPHHHAQSTPHPPLSPFSGLPARRRHNSPGRRRRDQRGARVVRRQRGVLVLGSAGKRSRRGGRAARRRGSRVEGDSQIRARNHSNAGRPRDAQTELVVAQRRDVDER